MKKIKQLNGFIIKEKRLDEIPSWVSDERRYAVFNSEGIFLEDNLFLDEAISFCEDNK